MMKFTITVVVASPGMPDRRKVVHETFEFYSLNVASIHTLRFRLYRSMEAFLN
jgi:hypothetical protein